MRRFSTDEIASFFEASPLTHSHTAAERCYVTNEGEIVHFFFCVSTPFLCFCVYVYLCVPACQLCVCVWIYCMCAFVFSLPIIRGCLGVAQECVSVLASVEKKNPYTSLKSLIKGWQIFLASCVVLRRLLGFSSFGVPLFAPSSPASSHP